MEEYYPKYLKDNNITCNRCNTKITITKKLAYSYLNECKKCTNLGTYGYLDNNYREYGVMSRNVYEECKCKTEYIYKTIMRCLKCTKCDKCHNELSYIELDNINTIDDKHLCKKCI